MGMSMKNILNMFLLWISEIIEVCNGEDFHASCHHNEIIVMTSAEYGRKEVGRCEPEQDDFMGCTNDVLPLLDRWCSGRRECSFEVPHDELTKQRGNCLKMLQLYVKATYIEWSSI